MRGWWYWASIVLVAAIYFAAGKLGLQLGFVEQVSAVWPPAGIALAAVVLSRYRLWPAVALGAFFTNATAQEPPWTAAGIALGNTLEALAGAWLLARWTDFRPQLDRLRDAVGLTVLGAIVSSMVAATIGVTSLCLGRVHPWTEFGVLWSVWWLGDAVGNLIVAPLVLSWAGGILKRAHRPRIDVEVALLWTCLASVSAIVFFDLWKPMRSDTLEYIIFPFIIWSALRLGPPVTALATLLVSGIAIAGTLHELGPFATGNQRESLVLLQTYIGVVGGTALILAAVVAEHRRMADSLRDSEERFRFLAETIPSVVWTAAPDGAITYANRRWLDYTGLTAEENARDWTRRVLHPDDHERCVTAWAAAVRAGKEYEIEVRNRRHDGVYRWFITRATPLRDSAGEILAWFGVTTDIQEQKELLERLRESDRRKDEFLAVLAHELRNPLAPIRNAVHVLRMAGPGDGRLDWARDIIERQVEQLARLTDDLLDVSRITRGKVTLVKETVDIAAIVARAVETSEPLIEARKQHLTVSLPPEPILVEADPTRIAQVLANLLNNASKYTEAGGRITLSAGIEAARVVLRVRDNGIGIAPEVLPRIFELFIQGQRALNRDQGGLGIGLTLARNLVELHGGTIEASSAGPGQGSEFCVRLPLLVASRDGASERTSQAEAASREPHADGNRRRVLVVDDNRDSAETLARLLALTGHEVKAAFDGPTALDVARAYRPEVVLLDIGLPRMDGYEVARRLRDQPESSGVCLVALTGYGQEEDRRRSKQAGFDYHLVKPVDPVVLEQVLAQSVGQPGRLA